MSDTKSQIQEDEKTPSKINTKRSAPQYNIYKLKIIKINIKI